ncbi:MAG: hypothetical protein HQM07_00110 [Zetaproteobacteria bacterium]|nr:hypothetical protein [Zetaproteobacteria bacterium]
MIDYGVIKVGSVKIGAMLFPGAGLLALGGFAVWQLMQLKKTMAENHLDVSMQVTDLYDKILELEYAKPVKVIAAPVASSPFHSEIKSTSNERKMAMLKGIMDDNLKLRNA